MLVVQGSDGTVAEKGGRGLNRKDHAGTRGTIWTLASRHSRMVELAIIQRNWSQAAAIVERAREEYERGDFLPPETPLRLVLSLSAHRRLEERGITQLGDIVRLSADDLRSSYGLSEGMVRGIEASLAEHGYSLRMG